MPKRRNAESASIERTSLSKKPASPAPVCMLYVLSISDHGPFTPLSRIKGTAFDKLKHLREIRDLRLCKPHASPYSMQSVCDQIHETVPKDLENNGYHRQCYQRFTGNLHLIENKTTEEPQASTSLLHSPRRHSTGPRGQSHESGRIQTAYYREMHVAYRAAGPGFHEGALVYQMQFF